MIGTTIDGQGYQFDDLHPDETVVELLRRRLGLTGTKLVCGSGVCVACTVLVDGTLMTSCLLPARCSWPTTAKSSRPQRSIHGCGRSPSRATASGWGELAGRELEEISAGLTDDASAAAQEWGRDLDLWQAAEALLQQLG